MYPLDAAQPFNEESLFSGSLEKTSIGYAMSKLLLSQGGIFLNQEDIDCKFISVIPNSCYGPKDDFNTNESLFLSAKVT